MTTLSFCGIDVSKDRLDVMVLPEQQSFSVGNDAAGQAALVGRLRGRAIAAIGLEASGGYERGAVRALLVAGLPVCQVNPFKLRQFARASGVLAKNDPLDTRLIASFVATMPTRPAQPRPPAIERLAEMLAVRR
jgi:transposase